MKPVDPAQLQSDRVRRRGRIIVIVAICVAAVAVPLGFLVALTNAFNQACQHGC
jgi:hypothetical protein